MSDSDYYDESPVSSRESSPVRGEKGRGTIYQDIGRQSPDAYDAILPKWRAAIRRKLLQSVHEESEIIAKMQVCIPVSGLHSTHTDAGSRAASARLGSIITLSTLLLSVRKTSHDQIRWDANRRRQEPIHSS